MEVPFNNTAKRDVSAVSPFAASSPSPADYYKECDGHCKIFVTSVFKSKTVRFKPICKKVSLLSYISLIQMHVMHKCDWGRG